jgi:hypothetical protein
MKPLVFALSFVVSLIVTAKAAAQVKPDSPEWKVMNRWVGAWTGETSGEENVLIPHARHLRGDYTAEWVLDGAFVYGRNGDDTGKTAATWMMNYDPVRKAYRLWYFDVNGASEWSGQWDEATNTMTWTSVAAQTGVSASDKTRFIDDDHQEWNMQIQDKDGTMKKIGGKLSRKK